MFFLKIIKDFQATIKKTQTLGYIQIVMALPLLYVSLYYIFYVFVLLLPIYYCKQLAEYIYEFKDRGLKLMLIVAEDAAFKAKRCQEALKNICIVLCVIAFFVVAHAIHVHVAYLYLLPSPFLFFGMYLLTLNVDVLSIPEKLNEYDEDEPEYLPEDLEIKPPKERPLKK